MDTKKSIIFKTIYFILHREYGFAGILNSVSVIKRLLFKYNNFFLLADGAFDYKIKLKILFFLGYNTFSKIMKPNNVIH